MDETFAEKRHPILCVNCSTPMVGMNKYIISQNNIYVWSVCPRRKTNDEKGCGHKTPVKIKQDGSLGIDNDKLIFEGTVKTYEKQTFVLNDDSESIHGWLYNHAKNLEGKKIRVIVEEIKPDIGSV